MNPPRMVLVGVGGYGRVHLLHLLDFHRRGEAVLVGAVVFPSAEEREILPVLEGIGCEVFAHFTALVAALPRLRADVGVVPTPIHLHAAMAVALLRAGVHVLVEKPLAASPDDAAYVARVAREVQRTVAVGFQYLHAPEVVALKSRLMAGAIGPLRRLVVHAAWPRSHAYYTRNDWAGRLQVGDARVLDSPVNNAISHFFMVMLFLAGPCPDGVARPVRLTGELYRAQDIESFDTGVVRLETAEGCQLDFYGTHSSREISRPSLTIEGRDGRAEWVQDSHARLTGPAGAWEQLGQPEAATREKMLRDVLRRVSGGSGFICTPELASVHVSCVTHLHEHVPIAPLAAGYRRQRDEMSDVFTYVPGLDAWLADAARRGIGLAEAGAPWGVLPTVVTLS